MADRHQVRCINKKQHSNPHERITHIGGISNGTRWKISSDDAIKGIETGQWAFYVEQVYNGQVYTAEVEVASRNGRKYLKTKNDGESPDNLLSLPECP